MSGRPGSAQLRRLGATISSLTPNLCVGSSQVDRLHSLGRLRRRPSAASAQTLRAAIRCAGSASWSTSTPAASSCARNRSEPSPAAIGAAPSWATRSASRSRRRHERLPELLPVGPVERREDLVSARVEDRQSAPPRLRAGGDPASERGQRADWRERQSPRLCQRPRGRDPDPEPGEGAGPDADREQADTRPAAVRLDDLEQLLEQRRGVPGTPGAARDRGTLGEHLIAADKGDDGLGGGRVGSQNCVRIR